MLMKGCEGERQIETILRPGERLDDLQRNGYRIIQDPGRFCFGMDAVLLSDFTRVRRGECVIDLGTGTGIIPILLAARTEAEQLAGLEIQQESADMARCSVRLNGLEERIRIVDGDIREADHIFGAACAQVVVSNPPYMIAEHGLLNADEPLAIAKHEIFCTLEDAVSQAARLLKPGGRFYLVHRPFRLTQIMETLRIHRLEPKRMRLVHPFIDKEPNMVLIEAADGGRLGLTVEKPLIVYREQGKYTDEIYEIYGRGRV